VLANFLTTPLLYPLFDMVTSFVWNGQNILKICWLNVVYYQNGYNAQSSSLIEKRIVTTESDII